MVAVVRGRARGKRRITLTGAVALLVAALLGGTAPDAVADDPSAGANTRALTSSTLVVPAGLAAAPFDRPHQVLVPKGWTMSLWARVPSARLAVWAPDGSMLVSRPGAGQVLRLVPDGRGTATVSTLLSGLTQPHGLAFAGSTLFVAESDAVDTYAYAAGRATAPREIASGLPDAKSPELGGAYAHALKSVAVGRDGSVYVSVGSTGNVSPVDRDATPQRASILRIPPGGGVPAPFARGVRNGTGLAIAPDGTPWTAVNNRDNIAYPYNRSWDKAPGSSYGKVIPSYVNDHPSEELAALTPGRDLGYPFCNPDPDPGAQKAGRTPTSVTTPRFARDVQTNADGSKLDCDRLPRIDTAFGAHSAPLGLSFVAGGLPKPYDTGALVGVHGSWNRNPPRAPEVSFFSWKPGKLGAQQTLVGGFQAPDGSRWGRPVAAVLGPDGAVYVTDDLAGAVYRLAPPGR